MKRTCLSKAGGLLAAAVVLTMALAPAGAAAADPGPDVRPKAVKALWKPPLNARWQYQLSGNTAYPATGGINVDVCEKPYGSSGACVRPQVFDIDLYADQDVTGNNHTLNTAAVQAIHARGAKAICYLDAGGIEKVRPDYQQFVDWHNAHGKSLIGKAYPGFEDENFANINNDKGQRDFMLQMTEARVAKCVQAGFDGVEFDVVNAYEEGKAITGWNISAATQLIFNRALADIAHRNGLSAALKNDLGQVDELLPVFDYAVNEQCYEELADDPEACDGLKKFVQAGKAVFHVEYNIAPNKFCGKVNGWNFNSIKKGADAELNDLAYVPCR